MGVGALEEGDCVVGGRGAPEGAKQANRSELLDDDSGVREQVTSRNKADHDGPLAKGPALPMPRARVDGDDRLSHGDAARTRGIPRGPAYRATLEQIRLE